MVILICAFAGLSMLFIEIGWMLYQSLVWFLSDPLSCRLWATVAVCFAPFLVIEFTVRQIPFLEKQNQELQDEVTQLSELIDQQEGKLLQQQRELEKTNLRFWQDCW